LNNFYSLPHYDWIHDKIKEHKGNHHKRNHLITPHFYSIEEYLKDINALSFFEDEDDSKTYCYGVKLNQDYVVLSLIFLHFHL